MAPPWEYTDPDSTRTLVVCAGGTAGRATLEARDPGGGATVCLTLPAEAVPSLARAAAEAAGVPAPVVLPRCSLPPALPVRIALGDVALGPGGVLEVYGPHGTGSVSPARVRAAAAALAALADRAEDEAGSVAAARPRP